MKVLSTGVAAAVATVALAPASSGAASTRAVKIQDVDFTPSSLAIRRGDTVVWRFLDGDTPHNVKSRGAKRFRSSATKATGTHRVTFKSAGTYRYVCTIHLNMRAKIVVR